MRYLWTVILLVLLFIWLRPAERSAPGADVGRTLIAFIRALTITFRRFAELDHAVQERAWQMMTGDWRAVLGFFRCLLLMLAIWGLYSLKHLRRLSRRLF